MSSTLAGWLQALALVGALALCYRPLGDYIARLLTSAKHLGAERGLYRLVGVPAAGGGQGRPVGAGAVGGVTAADPPAAEPG
ncbi:hypothetical protein ACFV6F_21405, partial [Kitasatospora phosalacinea]